MIGASVLYLCFLFFSFGAVAANSTDKLDCPECGSRAVRIAHILRGRAAVGSCEHFRYELILIHVTNNARHSRQSAWPVRSSPHQGGAGTQPRTPLSTCVKYILYFGIFSHVRSVCVCFQ